MFFDLLRYGVFGLFAAASAMALGSWAVRTRRISPFSKAAGLIRRTTDPVLEPIERQLLRRGGNPQQAGLWLVGTTVVGGILLINGTGFVLQRMALIGRAGPTGIVLVVGEIITWALFIRVIGSWLGAGRFNKFMRPVYFLTDWIVEPLRRIIPPIGMIDVSPIVAYFLIQILLGFLV